VTDDPSLHYVSIPPCEDELVDYNIGGWLGAQLSRNPDGIAIVDGSSGARATYREAEDRAARLAAALQARGIGRGDRVALLSTNNPDLLIVMFAVAKLGGITVPLNFRLAPEELAYILGDSGATLVFASSDVVALAEAAAAARNGAVEQIVVIGTGEAGNHESLADFVGTATPLADTVPVEADDVCLLMYTSGTTGRPKGAMLTHGNITWNAINMIGAGDGLRRSDVTLSVAPLFHIGALGIYSLPLLYLGGTVVTIDRFDPEVTLELMDREGVTVQFLVPTMWNAVMHSPRISQFDASRIRWVMTGGAPCPLSVITFFTERGWPFLEGFGLTETSPTCTVMDSRRVLDKAGSVGRPLRHVECRVVADDGSDVHDGRPGELLVRGPNVFSGYWQLPDATSSALADGWFHTGDVAVRDSEGFYTIVDRKKDMIITGGENVYPVEVERVLTDMPDLADVAVIGVPDETWGERVLAVVVPEPGGTVEPDDVVAFCRDRLAHYKCPRRVEFVDQVPRNATGKILKGVLRAEFGGTAAALTR
jgi:fatty-acyl-CoA synthase